jgi:hypothetical protein
MKKKCMLKTAALNKIIFWDPHDLMDKPLMI